MLQRKIKTPKNLLFLKANFLIQNYRLIIFDFRLSITRYYCELIKFHSHRRSLSSAPERRRYFSGNLILFPAVEISFQRPFFRSIISLTRPIIVQFSNLTVSHTIRTVRSIVRLRIANVRPTDDSRPIHFGDDDFLVGRVRFREQPTFVDRLKFTNGLKQTFVTRRRFFLTCQLLNVNIFHLNLFFSFFYFHRKFIKLAISNFQT